MDVDPVRFTSLQGSLQEVALNTERDVSQIKQIKERIFSNFLCFIDAAKTHAFSLVDPSVYYFFSRYKCLLQSSLVNEEDKASLLLLESIVSSAEQQLLGKIKLSAELNIIKNETDLTPCFEAAVKSCRQQELYLCEYLIKQLYVSEVLLNLNSSEEEIYKAMEIELDLLNSFKRFTISGEEAQTKYEQHFENYLNLLCLLFHFPLEPCKTLSDKSSAIDTHFNSLLELSQEEKQDLAYYHCSYLHSRKEWYFKNDMNQAWLFLLEAKKKANSNNAIFRAKVETRLLTLEFYDRDAIKPAEKEQLVSWLKSIISLKISKTLSSSDDVEITFLQAKIYEQLLLHEPENVSLRTSFRTTLEELVNIKKESLTNLNFTALKTLSKASFELGFHLIFHSIAIEDRKKGVELLKKLQENFWTDPEFAASAEKLVLCASYDESPTLLTVSTQEKEQLLQDFKLLLLGDIHSFFFKFFYGSNDTQLTLSWTTPESLNSKNFVLDDTLVWSQIQEKFVSFLDSNDIKNAKDVFNALIAHFLLKIENEFDDLYSKKVNKHTGFFAFSFPLQDQAKNQIGRVGLNISDDLVKTFFQRAKLNPGLEILLPIKENYVLGDQEGMRLHLEFQKDSKLTNVDVQMPHHSSTYFLTVFKACENALSSFEGQIAYGPVIESTLKGYAYILQRNSFLYDVMSSDVKPSKSNNFLKIRHHIPTMQHIGCLVLLRNNLSQACFPNIKKDAMLLFHEKALEACSLLAAITPQISLKIKYLKEVNCLFSSRIAILQFEEPDSIECLEQQIFCWHNLAMMFIIANNPKDKFDYAEEVFPYLPDNFAEFQLLGERCNENSFNCLGDLLIMQTMYLIFKGQKEKGFKLIEDFFNYSCSQITNTRIKFRLGKFKKIILQRQYKIEFKVSINTTFVNLKKLSGGNFYEEPQLAINNALRQSLLSLSSDKESADSVSRVKKTSPQNYRPLLKNALFDRNFSSSPSSLDEEPLSAPSNTAREVRQNATELLKKEQLKEEKKNQRIHSSSKFVTTSDSSSLLNESHLDKPSSQINITLSHKNMRIFEQFWIKNDPDEQGSWETLSFRNNLSIKRQEALKLIVALGGRYSASRGHGSHHVSHLPKIEFNNCDVGGLVDFETGELMITLTNNEYLKFYQISQLRRILIQQGFTPDTVSKQQNPATE